MECWDREEEPGSCEERNKLVTVRARRGIFTRKRGERGDDRSARVTSLLCACVFLVDKVRLPAALCTKSLVQVQGRRRTLSELTLVTNHPCSTVF